MLPVDHPYHDDPHQCWDTNCALLPLGYALLMVDSFFDLQWVLFPSAKTARQLRGYYTWLLRPTLYHPGYLFPIYCIYKLCVACPTQYNYILALLFLPLTWRYMGIFSGTDRLGYWWTVVAIRMLLAICTFMSRKSCQCDDSYVMHVKQWFEPWL